MTVLRSFDRFDGDYSFVSITGLVLSSDGNFYGTTLNSGKGLTDLFYRLSPSGAFTVLREFPPNVEMPTTTLIEARDGAFYGGDYNGILRLTREGKVTKICSFRNAFEGSSVWGALVQASDGNLYGTTVNGSAGGAGSVFRLRLGPSVGRAPGNGDVDGDGISVSTLDWRLVYSLLIAVPLGEHRQLLPMGAAGRRLGRR